MSARRQPHSAAQGHIAAIDFYLPEKKLTTEDLATEHPEWDLPAIDARTGIRNRYVAADNQCASDLAFLAARKLFYSGACQPEEIAFLILCTQTPDYFLPTTACLLQNRLGIPKTAGAMDISLGCSGFIYGLGIAHGLIASGQVSNVLLITAETYSKFISPANRAVRPLFSDAAAATMIRKTRGAEPLIGPFVYGSDGSGGSDLIVRGGGMRARCVSTDAPLADSGSLFMDGKKLVGFALREIPIVVEALLRRAGIEERDVDLFVFHQANNYLLEQIRKLTSIPEEKLYLCIAQFGNTVSSTIPISLKCAAGEGKLRNGSLVMTVGFGVGYSWAATLLRWGRFEGVEPGACQRVSEP